jgi:hypothetical protein
MSWTKRGKRQVVAPTIFVAIAVCEGQEVEFKPPRSPKRTKAKPGSQQKIAVLARRLERGEELWNDGDRKYPHEFRP